MPGRGACVSHGGSFARKVGGSRDRALRPVDRFSRRSSYLSDMELSTWWRAICDSLVLVVPFRAARHDVMMSSFARISDCRIFQQSALIAQAVGLYVK